MTLKESLRLTFGSQSVRRSMTVAIVVGTALNLINQGAEVIGGNSLVLWKLTLTYAVPFLVASYGSYAAFRSAE
jgi:hypothetical protein